MINTKASWRRDASKGATLNECFQAIGFGRYQITIFIVLAICGFSDGMEVLVLAFLYRPLQVKWQISDYMMGILGSLIFFGVFLGSWFGGMMGDKYGRKKVLFIGSMMISLFGGLSAIAPTFWLLLLCRLVVGLGLGGIGPSAFSLATEFCPPERRGMILVLLGQMFSFGEMIESLLAWMVMDKNEEDSWRPLLGLSAIPSFVAVILIWKYVPESIRYLAVSGKKQELHEMLAEIAKTNGPASEANLASVLGGGQIIDLPSEMDPATVHPRELFKGDQMWTTLQLWFIWFVQSFVYYGLTFILPLAVPEISGHTKVGIVRDNVYLTSFLAAAAELPGVGLAALITDISWIGRRKSLAFFMFVAAICCSIAALSKSDLVLFTIGLMLAKCTINGSFSIAWTYTAEYYPTSARTTGLGACSAMSRLGGVCTPFLSTFLLHLSFFLPFTLYAIVATLGTLCSMALKVETSGLDLSDSVDKDKREEEKVSLLLSRDDSDLMPSDMRLGIPNQRPSTSATESQELS